MDIGGGRRVLLDCRGSGAPTVVRLAEELRARHVTDTDSGHGIAVERPGLVARAIRDVVERARAGQER
ncbi:MULTISPECIES: hypothetical protein [unclassified Streptomyces]|uniref:hypothetical protein n=1 Tax=unclassified Streptomyces TaxID=2593676 RepID=UPI0004BDE877|nr:MULTISPECIES: hypothetical protein [unclassified Streptomyces]